MASPGLTEVKQGRESRGKRAPGTGARFAGGVPTSCRALGGIEPTQAEKACPCVQHPLTTSAGRAKRDGRSAGGGGLCLPVPVAVVGAAQEELCTRTEAGAVESVRAVHPPGPSRPGRLVVSRREASSGCPPLREWPVCPALVQGGGAARVEEKENKAGANGCCRIT